MSIRHLEQHFLALCCSRQVPGRPILLALDLATTLRDAGIGVIGGFQTSVERDCLDFLLKGSQPVVVVAPRGPYSENRIPANLRPGLAAGNVSLIYPYAEGHARVTRETSAAANALVDELAAAMFVIHASEAGETWRRAERLIAVGKSVFTFSVPENEALLQAGAVGIEPEIVRDPARLQSSIGW
ncbi:MAG: hypothetical protein AB7V46_12145 [Thermomicrobiales bacterium]